MLSIANRFRDRYPHLFTKDTINNVDIISSGKDRSIESAHHFLRGLFHNIEEKLYSKLINELVIDNKMMRLFDECQSYLDQVKHNSSAFNELLLFEKIDHMNGVVHSFKKRHNILNFEAFNASLH